MQILNTFKKDYYEEEASGLEYKIIIENINYKEKIKSYVYFLGVDRGGKAEIYFKENSNIIIKFSGHNSWCSRGDSKYYPPKFSIGKLQMLGLENTISYKEYYKIEFCKGTM